VPTSGRSGTLASTLSASPVGRMYGGTGTGGTLTTPLMGRAAGVATVTVTVAGPGRIAASVVIGFQPSAEDIAFTLLDNFEIESGLTVRQALRLIAAVTAGKISGAGGTTITIRNAVADTDDRVTATVDGNGNRTAITYDLN
ncbi:MAG: hypothetical protein ACK5XN_40275, partial [Bacteroidota bacterium]